MGIKTETLEGGYEKLLEPFTAYGNTVPKGFVSDGASVPRLFWAILPPFKQTKEAAFMHDYLCRIAKNKKDRKKADDIFRMMLMDHGVDEATANIAHTALRIGAFVGIGVFYPHWSNRYKGRKPKWHELSEC